MHKQYQNTGDESDQNVCSISALELCVRACARPALWRGDCGNDPGYCSTMLHISPPSCHFNEQIKWAPLNN
jgi:hypothetical protein